MRFAALIIGSALLQAQDPRALVEQGLKRDLANEELARNYAYIEVVAEQEWKDGAKTRLKSQTFEVIDLYGEPYRRLVKKDGMPLSAEEEEKQQKKLDKLAAERAKETPKQRQRRIAKYLEERRKNREFRKEIPNAYSFTLAGTTMLNGREAWMIDATPLAGYKPKDSRSKLLTKFKGRFYLAKADATLLKLEAEAIDSMSFGLGLAKLDRGARFMMETTHVNGELWMPSRIKVDFDARLALFKKLHVDLQIDYGNFRKFQSDSRLIATPGGQ